MIILGIQLAFYGCALAAGYYLFHRRTRPIGIALVCATLFLIWLKWHLILGGYRG